MSLPASASRKSNACSGVETTTSFHPSAAVNARIGRSTGNTSLSGPLKKTSSFLKPGHGTSQKTKIQSEMIQKKTQTNGKTLDR